MSSHKSNKPKKGGSLASDSVVKLVSPAAFESLNSMFSNKLSIGGGTNCNKRAIPKVNLNETANARMMVYNKSGGKGNFKKTGGGLIPNVVGGPVGRMDSGFIPPPAVPSTSSTSLDMTSIPQSQQALLSMSIDTMHPIVKTTVFPETNMYKGPFAFGGKSVASKSKPKAKPDSQKAKAKKAAKKPAAKK
jgi:hypothetical protein